MSIRDKIVEAIDKQATAEVTVRLTYDWYAWQRPTVKEIDGDYRITPSDAAKNLGIEVVSSKVSNVKTRYRASRNERGNYDVVIDAVVRCPIENVPKIVSGEIAKGMRWQLKNKAGEWGPHSPANNIEILEGLVDREHQDRKKVRIKAVANFIVPGDMHYLPPPGYCNGKIKLNPPGTLAGAFVQSQLATFSGLRIVDTRILFFEGHLDYVNDKWWPDAKMRVELNITGSVQKPAQWKGVETLNAIRGQLKVQLNDASIVLATVISCDVGD